MNKHTPGPWILDSPDCDPTIDDSIGNCVISGNRDGGLYARVAADLVLATAAPDLLEALAAAMAFIDCHAADPDLTAEMCEKYAALRATNPEAAIARARGES